MGPLAAMAAPVPAWPCQGGLTSETLPLPPPQSLSSLLSEAEARAESLSREHGALAAWVAELVDALNAARDEAAAAGEMLREAEEGRDRAAREARERTEQARKAEEARGEVKRAAAAAAASAAEALAAAEVRGWAEGSCSVRRCCTGPGYRWTLCDVRVAAGGRAGGDCGSSGA